MGIDERRQTADGPAIRVVPRADSIGLSARDVHSLRVSRRSFVGGLLAAAGSGLVAACAGGTTGVVTDRYATGTPAQVLASPRALEETPLAGESTPEAEGRLGLEQFLMLSAVLTGIENLNAAEGRAYLHSLQESNEFDVTLRELYEQAGFGNGSAPATIEDLDTQGIFESEATSSLADRIIEYWYTGIYTTAEGEQAVATFVDALAWKVLNFTKPNSICASPGFWEEAPRN